MLTRTLAAAPEQVKSPTPEIVRAFYNNHDLTKSYLHALVDHQWGSRLDEAVAESEGAANLFLCKSSGTGTIVLIVNPELDVRNPPRTVIVLKPHGTKETTWLRSNLDLDLRTVFSALSNGFLTSPPIVLTHPFHIPYARSPYKEICMFLKFVYPKQRFNNSGSSISMGQKSSTLNVNTTFDPVTEGAPSLSPDPTVSDMILTNKRVARPSRAAREAQANALAAATGTSTAEAPVKRSIGRPMGSKRKVTLVPNKYKVNKVTKTTKMTRAAEVAPTSSTTVVSASSTTDDGSDVVLIKGRGRPRRDGLPNSSSHYIKRDSGTPVDPTTNPVAVDTAPVVADSTSDPTVAVPVQSGIRLRLRNSSGTSTAAPVNAPAPKAGSSKKKKMTSQKKTTSQKNSSLLTSKRIITANITVGNSPEAVENRKRLVAQFWVIRRQRPYAPMPKFDTTTQAPETYPKDFVARALSVPTLVNMQRANFMSYDLSNKKTISGLKDVDLICALICEWDGKDYIKFKRIFFNKWVEMDGWAQWNRAEWLEFIIRKTEKHVRDPKAARIMDMYQNLGWLV